MSERRLTVNLDSLIMATLITMHYVSGFLFDDAMDRVVLIRKARPKWQAGKWNAVGGAVEKDDASCLAAIAREFAEETGVTFADWWPFASLPHTTRGHRIDFFAGRSTDALERAMTPEGSDETVCAFHVASLLTLPEATFPAVSNVRWLILMARAIALGLDSAGGFVILETPKVPA